MTQTSRPAGLTGQQRASGVAAPAEKDRDARKQNQRTDREMFTAVCANCGKEAKVPFRPREDRPVYCSECFAKMKEEQ